MCLFVWLLFLWRWGPYRRVNSLPWLFVSTQNAFLTSQSLGRQPEANWGLLSLWELCSFGGSKTFLYSQVLESLGLNTSLCWTRCSLQRTLGSHGPHVLVLFLSKVQRNPSPAPERSLYPVSRQLEPAPEHPPWHNLGNWGPGPALPAADAPAVSQAHVSPGAPLVPLHWAVTMPSTVSRAVLWLESK